MTDIGTKIPTPLRVAEPTLAPSITMPNPQQVPLPLEDWPLPMLQPVRSR